MPDDKPEKPLKAGDVVHLTTAASVQFLHPIFVRVIRELPERHTYDGWVWIDCYELNAAQVPRMVVHGPPAPPPLSPAKQRTGRAGCPTRPVSGSLQTGFSAS
ncbi:hypothetical protein LUPAC06_00643 [Micromonospora saelicesensis]|uniref:hypothetical protein n=1 Tax=Micromonospora saelicesensis TaxID=285676 RepID=UPI000DBFADB2|nr:hypothetical protein [Micromonospora saelicesensis]RAO62280.1 hypothetical protein LUPAC06_00643 [Micromonospora saelicesensis]